MGRRKLKAIPLLFCRAQILSLVKGPLVSGLRLGQHDLGKSLTMSVVKRAISVNFVTGKGPKPPKNA